MPSTHIPTADELRERAPGQSFEQYAQALRSARSDHYRAAEDLRYRGVGTGQDLTASEERAFKAHLDDVEDLSKLIDQLSASPEGREIDYSQVIASGSGPAPHGAGYAEGAALTRDQTFRGFVQSTGLVRDGEEGLSLGRYLRGVVTGRWDGADGERRAMAEGALAGGGYLLPAPMVADIIDLARNRTRVLAAGARVLPMPNRTLDVARWEGDPTPAWHSEAAAIIASDGTIGRVQLAAKSLAGETVVSRELLEDAPNVEDELRAAFAAQFALTLDRAALYGSGTAPEPRGVKNTSGVTVQSMGANGAAITNYDWLVDAVGTLADRNEVANGILYSPRTARAIGKLKATDNQPMMAPDYISGIPRYDTAQVPTNLTQGTSTTASDAFTADWSQLLIGVRTELQIQVLVERHSGTGQIGFLAWWRGDVAVARASAFVVTTGIL